MKIIEDPPFRLFPIFPYHLSASHSRDRGLLVSSGRCMRCHASRRPRRNCNGQTWVWTNSAKLDVNFCLKLPQGHWRSVWKGSGCLSQKSVLVFSFSFFGSHAHLQQRRWLQQLGRTKLGRVWVCSRKCCNLVSRFLDAVSQSFHRKKLWLKGDVTMGWTARLSVGQALPLGTWPEFWGEKCGLANAPLRINHMMLNAVLTACAKQQDQNKADVVLREMHEAVSHVSCEWAVAPIQFSSTTIVAFISFILESARQWLLWILSASTSCFGGTPSFFQLRLSPSDHATTWHQLQHFEAMNACAQRGDAKTAATCFEPHPA